MLVKFKRKNSIQLSTFLFFITVACVNAMEPKKEDPEQSELQIEGRMMWDSSIFNGVHHDGKWDREVELRDAQITFKSKLNKIWKMELQLDFDQDDEIFKVADANIQYIGWKELQLTLGREKEPFGLEQLTSSASLTFVEPAMTTEAFAPSRNNGMSLSWDADKMLWSVGLYNLDKEDTDRNHHALTGRWVYTPWHRHNQVLHLGLAGSIRSLGGEKYHIAERAEVHTADKIVTSAKSFADQVKLLGLESAWVNGPFSVQGEYMMARVEAETRVSYIGYYLLGSYFLTGESRSYEKGRFGKVKSHASSGAWELTARYSVLDTQENGSGSKGTNITLGINYYVNAHIRLMVNNVYTQLTKKGLDDTGQAFLLRIQYETGVNK